MKRKTKALLVSAFVFPGGGQFVFKRYKSAFIIMALAIGLSGFIITDVVSKALAITDKILSGGVESNLFTIRELVTQQQAASDSSMIVITTWLLVAVWLISMIDIFRIKVLD